MYRQSARRPQYYQQSSQVPEIREADIRVRVLTVYHSKQVHPTTDYLLLLGGTVAAHRQSDVGHAA